MLGELLLASLLAPAEIVHALPSNFSPLTIAPLIAGGLAYALLTRRALARLPAGAVLPRHQRVANTLIESTIPGLFILVIARLVDPELALSAPPVLLYFLLLILSVLRLEPALCLLTSLAGALQYTGLVVLLADDRGLVGLLPHLGRAIVLLVSGVVAALVAARIRQRLRDSLRLLEEHHRVLAVFGQHVSPAVAEALVHSTVAHDGELRRVCVMFLDVRGFTRFAEARNPDSVVRFLDTLFDPMIAVVGRHRGIINKFLGDGFMAVFGAPLPSPHPGRDAVAAAREILAGIERQVADGRLPPTRVGIGLHLGEALTGTIGSAERKEYTVIGDVVNLAARIEQLTKQHDARLLVSQEVADALGEADHDAIGEVAVPGRDAPVTLLRLA